MRLLKAVLILALGVPASSPAAVTYSVQPTLNILDLNYSGNRGFVQEYDGKKYGVAEGAIQFSGEADKFAYLDMGVNGINSGNEDGYIGLNLGSYLSFKGNFMVLTHRQPFSATGFIANGQLVNSFGTRTDIAASLTPNMKDLTNFGAMSSDMSVRRVENAAKIAVACPSNPDYKLTVGAWQEEETGQIPVRFTHSQYTGDISIKMDKADLDRQTRDVTVGLSAPLKEGAVSADYTQRAFSDATDERVNPILANLNDMRYVSRPDVGNLNTKHYDVRFRGNPDSPVSMTGSLSARTRRNELNGYESGSYVAAVAGAYKPRKDMSFTAKLEARTANINEDDTYLDPFSRGWDVSGGGSPSVDRHGVLADLKGRYKYSDKLSFKAGYKFENTGRRHAGHHRWYFEEAHYADGSYTAADTQHNGIAVQDTKHSMTAGVDMALPYEAEFGLEYKKMKTNQAVLESLPTDQDQVDASLNVPLPADFSLMALGGMVKEKNRKANTTDSRMSGKNYMTGLEWSGSSKVSAGADYSYEQASYRSTGYFGMADNPTGAVILTNIMRVPGMLYRVNNYVYGCHATVNLPKGFTVTGRASYTRSRGDVPVHLDKFRDVLPVVVSNLGPSNIRMTSEGVSLKYTHTQDLTASLGYRYDKWIDKVVSSDNGKLQLLTLGVSAKF